MKIYQAGDLEIHDLSGKKTIEQLKKKFNKEDVVDITEAYNAKIAEGRLAKTPITTLEERIKALEEKIGREVA